MRRQIVRIRIPKLVKEVVESADTGRITKRKSAKDCVEWIYFQLCSPISKGMHFKINGKQIGTLHTGRSPWFWTKDGIFTAEQFISIRKIKIPETFNDAPCGFRKNSRIRIIFTKIFKHKSLIGGMTAGINR